MFKIHKFTDFDTPRFRVTKDKRIPRFGSCTGYLSYGLGYKVVTALRVVVMLIKGDEENRGWRKMLSLGRDAN